MPASTRPTRPPHFDDPLRPHNPLVAHRWILGGIGLMVMASLAAVYFAIGLLFWQGQWQLIFHPSHVMSTTPASDGVPFEDVRFDATETGQTQLDGWWIPANSSLPGKRAGILYVHDARGSLSNALPDLLALHALGKDVFAFDPRGFGKSEWAKPSEGHWNQDSDAALYYLASVRHIGPRHLIVVGRGLGGTVGANLTIKHPEIQSLVMIDPQPPTLGLLEAPHWTHILPVRILARDRFNPATALKSTSLDKLFLLPANAAPPGYITEAAPPAAIVRSTVLGNADTASALKRFAAQSHAERDH
jgi:pimeloyl-ACP methyl ester carboxylesterase